jgi:hypothetical protein
MIDVRIAPAVAAKDTALVHELADLVNRCTRSPRKDSGRTVRPARLPRKWPN